MCMVYHLKHTHDNAQIFFFFFLTKKTFLKQIDEDPINLYQDTKYIIKYV